MNGFNIPDSVGRIPPFAAANAPAIFWTSLALAILSIFKTSKSEKFNRWDLLFLLSSWQVFDLEFWEYYLGGFISPYGYPAASVLLVLLARCYALRRGLTLGGRFSKADFFTYLKHFAALTLLIPIGLAMGFLKFHPVLDPKSVILNISYYFAFVAPAEELVFRGIIFNLLARIFKPWPAILITTSFFASMYTHISGAGSFPNWTYVGFAFAAGLGYTHSYLKSKNIMVPIFLHGTVDAVWRIFLS